MLVSRNAYINSAVEISSRVHIPLVLIIVADVALSIPDLNKNLETSKCGQTDQSSEVDIQKRKHNEFPSENTPTFNKDFGRNRVEHEKGDNSNYSINLRYMNFEKQEDNVLESLSQACSHIRFDDNIHKCTRQRTIFRVIIGKRIA
jgi:hypothetical protein